MSGFSSRCLINIENIIDDVDEFRTLLKSDREQTIKELTESCVNCILPGYGESNALDGYYAQVDWYGDANEAIIGLENQDALIAFAESMKDEAKKTAKCLVKSAGIMWSASVGETIDVIETDGLKSYLVCHAFEILDNRVNSDCDAIYFKDGCYWSAWPTKDDLAEIKENPEKWGAIEILFK